MAITEGRGVDLILEMLANGNLENDPNGAKHPNGTPLLVRPREEGWLRH